LSSRRSRFVALIERLHREHPEITDPAAAIAAGRVLVDGVFVTNPRSVVPRHAPVTIVAARPLRGTVKLRAALAAFDVTVGGRVAADIGAAAGGFTTALLEAGACRVYAIDAGYGQLRGSLRQDPRVVNLERTNIGVLARTGQAVVPEPVDLVTIDLSYLALADAVPQLEALTFRAAAGMLALVKPMYELGLASVPDDETAWRDAVGHAAEAIARGPWAVQGTVRSPAPGRRGAVEFFIYARRGRPRPAALGPRPGQPRDLRRG
jgi:23S rRNA (cytidine1920-2'-O)/16S rRNA (cytidine1409-2'-O)-methyltransferase